jgi:hypothetical protein
MPMAINVNAMGNPKNTQKMKMPSMVKAIWGSVTV